MDLGTALYEGGEEPARSTGRSLKVADTQCRACAVDPVGANTCGKSLGYDLLAPSVSGHSTAVCYLHSYAH